MNLNTWQTLKEINANYQTRYEARFCSRCETFRAHLIAVAPVPMSQEQVTRVECTHCLNGETRLS